MIAALEGLRQCDAPHEQKAKGCKDCERRLPRLGALLLLAILPTPSSIPDLIEQANRFRRAYPMAWPHVGMGNAQWVVRVLDMSGADHLTAADYQSAADGYARQLDRPAA